MSKDKNRAHRRAMSLLGRMTKAGKLWLNCEGGIAADNPDLAYLVKRGLVVIKRTGGVPKWTKKFHQRPEFFNGRFHEGFIRRTYAEVKL